MTRPTQSPPLALDHFLVDPELREVYGDTVIAGAHDDTFDRHLGSIRKSNSAANVATDRRQSIAHGEVPQATLRAIDNLERTAAAQEYRTFADLRAVFDTLEAASLALDHIPTLPMTRIHGKRKLGRVHMWAGELGPRARNQGRGARSPISSALSASVFGSRSWTRSSIRPFPLGVTRRAATMCST